MRVLSTMVVGLTLSCGPTSAEREPVSRDWSPEGVVVVWHHEEDAVAPRTEWGMSGREPLDEWVTEDGRTRFELVIESHGGLPDQTGADEEAWGFPLYFGHGGPFVADGTLHMFECSARGGVYDAGPYIAFCEPGEAILYVAFPAAGTVAIADRPRLPEPFGSWWESTIAYSAPREPFTVIPKYVTYGRTGETFELDVTFEPRAKLPAEPWDDRSIERWRTAKYDDR